MQFLDEAKIFIKSGNGGNGCVSFRREKFIPFGGPDGGDGGKGGNIFFKVVGNLNTLIDYRYKQHFKAQSGEGGKGKTMSGKKGKDIILNIPKGTCIYAEDRETLIMDLSEDDAEIKFLKGGKGGLGNTHFKSSTNQAPRRFTKGEIGEEMWVWLKLKLLSDVGLVGLPNAGKSTFLSKVTRAKPKIADYPFTTLVPQLGVVYIDESEFVIADIPGLIENAHQGTGLGHRFLKHIERCRIILHLIDVHEDVVQAYKTIRNELELFSENLLNKKELVVLTKKDSISEEELKEKIYQLQELTDTEIDSVSSVSGDNLEKILRKLNNEVKPKDED